MCSLVLVVLDEEPCLAGRPGDGARRVLPLGRQAVGAGTLKELGLACLHVGALPGLDGGGLQSATVAEGESPWLLGDGGLVNGIQVHRGLLLGLAAGQEADAGHRRGHRAGKGQHGRLGGERLMTRKECDALLLYLLTLESFKPLEATRVCCKRKYCKRTTAPEFTSGLDGGMKVMINFLMQIGQDTM